MSNYDDETNNSDIDSPLNSPSPDSEDYVFDYNDNNGVCDFDHSKDYDSEPESDSGDEDEVSIRFDPDEDFETTRERDEKMGCGGA
jgi:hypothetical protein